MEIKTFAPVVIPTLCRYEHLKRCLESLEHCTWANKTDVYVGLDYPPSEKYVEGWKKIDAYLAGKEQNNGFKNLYVRRRDHNCGVSNPTSNFQLLLKECKELSDRFIFSEDDNEFSPNFLDYINKGLEIYKDNDNVFSICGYNYPIDMSTYQYDYYFSHELSAWGYGSWFKKRKEVFKIIKAPNYIIDLYKSYPLGDYFKNNLKLMSLAARIGDGFLGDVYLTSYLHSRNIYTVFPKVSKVRNWGHDGSGVNCGKEKITLEELYTKQIIDDRKEFNYDDGIPLSINNKANKIVQNFKKPSYRVLLLRLVLFILVRTYSKLKR